jgi:hypothetical protein
METAIPCATYLYAILTAEIVFVQLRNAPYLLVATVFVTLTVLVRLAFMMMETAVMWSFVLLTFVTTEDATKNAITKLVIMMVANAPQLWQLQVWMHIIQIIQKIDIPSAVPLKSTNFV